METDPKPIFDFKPLRNFLTQKGYIVEQSQGYREIRPEEVTIKSINEGKIEFNNDGIFVIGPNDDKQQVFLYKRDYHLFDFGKPRFHICKCATIVNFINIGKFKEHYVRANTSSVPVINLDDNNNEEEISGLPLCKYCLSMIRQYGNIDSSGFVEILKQAKGDQEELEIQEVDIFGYTKDWERISREYRELHNYTCEKCGLRIDDIFDRQYMHCHHKDFNKLNNTNSNLQCLCLKCHSEVDELHRQNLQIKGANAKIFDSFIQKYK